MDLRNNNAILYRIVASIIFTALLSSCSLPEKIPGTYSSKFYSNGFFKTFIDLNTDSSFYYQFVGDMIDKRGIGNYIVKGRNIQLKYSPSKYDSLLFGVREDTVWGPNKKLFKIVTVGTPIKVFDSVEVETRPTNFYFQNGKLFGINSKGELYKGKGFVYSPRKKYFLFGTHYFNRRNPLRKYRPKET